MKKILLIIAVLSVGYFNISYAQAPGGTYQKTCRQCSMDRGTLYCKCQRANGMWQRTALNTARKCIRAKNVNGRLECREWVHHPRPEPRPVYPRHHRFPANSYRNSCNQCTKSGNSLSCMCKKANGTRVRSTFIGSCHGKIQNNNGALVCG